MKKTKIISLMLVITLSLSACSINNNTVENDIVDVVVNTSTENESSTEPSTGIDIFDTDIEYQEIVVYDETVPAYSGEPYYELRGGRPWFAEHEYTTDEFETYSELDELGRCGTAYANISPYTMPTEERGPIGHIKPSGWQTIKYNIVEGKYLYNRCHLIGFQLAGENANEQNLITGTRYLNIDGMLEHENLIANYVEDTGNHVLYRVTPFYTGDNLVADGVLMEAYSVEDDGVGIEFCIFAYNVQPGIKIDYATGQSCLAGGNLEDSMLSDIKSYEANELGIVYIINTESKKYHMDTCKTGLKTKEENRESFNGTIEWLHDNGYSPCKTCKPDETTEQIENTDPFEIDETKLGTVDEEIYKFEDLPDEERTYERGLELMTALEKAGKINQGSVIYDEVADAFFFEYLDGPIGRLSIDLSFTEEDLNNMEYVDSELSKFWEQDKSYRTKENAEKLLYRLEKQGYIKNILWDEHSETFSFQYESGALGGLMLKEFDTYMN